MAQFEQGLQVSQTPLGHFEVPSVASAQGLPAGPNFKRVRRVVIRPTVDIRYRDDGVDPAPTGAGLIVEAGQLLVYDGDSTAALKFIATSTDGPVAVAYYGL